MGFKSVFTSHVYRQNGKYFLQGDKGPIGHIVTGSAARLVLIDFDRNFITLVKRLKIEMFLFARYVDDVDLSVKRMKRGLEYDSEKRELIDKTVGTIDVTMMNDDEMMELLQNMANSICQMLTWEADMVS